MLFSIKTLKKLLPVCITVIGFNTHAALLVEPLVGLSLNGGGDSKIKVDNGNTTNWENDYSALGYGLRLGYESILGIMVGAEYSAQLSHGMKVKNKASGTFTYDGVETNEYEFDASTRNIGIFVGYSFPILLRVWGTFFFDSTLSVEADATPRAVDANGNEYDGSGRSFGVGYTGLPFISVNLEYRTFEWDEKRPRANSNYTADHEASEIFLSVSAPFSF